MTGQHEDTGADDGADAQRDQMDRPKRALEIVPHVYGESLSQQNAHWLLSKILSYLQHLQALGRAREIPGDPQRWAA